MAIEQNYTNLICTSGHQYATIWAFKPRKFHVQNSLNIKPVKEIVATSKRIQRAIEDEMRRMKRDRSIVEAEVMAILTEMQHNFSLTAARCVGYVLRRAFQKLLRGLMVNVENLRLIRELSADVTVVFVPSHRSYLDFLLVSYLCFEFELTLPAIAAAIDFMDMKFVSEVIRRCGAFFVRRNSGDNALYREVCAEYIRQLVRSGERPLEFFLEGTRSRTGKTLLPKLGLLTAILEPFFTRKVYDLAFVPVSISYERLPEESLFAFELLGFPKPAESTSALWKARAILQDNFGHIFVHFDRPIRARDYFVHECSGKRGRLETREFASTLVQRQQKHAVLTLWPLVCVHIRKVLARLDSIIEVEWQTIDYEGLARSVQTQLALAKRLGYSASFCYCKCLRNELSVVIDVHSNLVRFDRDRNKPVLKVRNLMALNGGELVEGEQILPRNLVQMAIPRLMFSNYANNVMHVYSNAAFIALSFNDVGQILAADQLESAFIFFKQLFCFEFVTLSTDTDVLKAEFADTLNALVSAGIIVTKIDRSYAVGLAQDVFELRAAVRPFVFSYLVVYRALLNYIPAKTSRLITVLRCYLIRSIFGTRGEAYADCLSADLIRNALRYIVGTRNLCNTQFVIGTDHALIVRVLIAKLGSFTGESVFQHNRFSAKL